MTTVKAMVLLFAVIVFLFLIKLAAIAVNAEWISSIVVPFSKDDATVIDVCPFDKIYLTLITMHLTIWTNLFQPCMTAPQCRVFTVSIVCHGSTV